LRLEPGREHRVVAHLELDAGLGEFGHPVNPFAAQSQRCANSVTLLPPSGGFPPLVAPDGERFPLNLPRCVKK
ncbi:MAG: hypothetical protein KF822_14495, partial [Steroidobacteraceae bacterium]|nr:hypothetical protein [Steroidobacteraceae bacterium]